MSKRRSLSETAEDYIDALRKIHDDARTVKLGKEVLRAIIGDLQRVVRIGRTADKILSDHDIRVQARMGRHARLAEEQGRFAEDLSWYSDARKHYNPKKGISWEQAYGKVADEFNVSSDTVKKACLRARKTLDSLMRPSATQA